MMSQSEPVSAGTPPDRSWQIPAVVLGAALVFAFHRAIASLVHVWWTKADYSHGFLVVPFAVYVLWLRRDRIPVSRSGTNPLGLVLIAVGLLLAVGVAQFNYAREFFQGIGLIAATAGVLMVVVGKGALAWAWPALGFMIFMVKMPDTIEILFTFKLRQIATIASNFLLQTLGYPSYIAGQGGTVITVNSAAGDVRLGVEWACSGLSMVLTFVAMGTAMALLMTKRPIWDRLTIMLSTLPIAIISNIIRITLTAIVYIAGWKSLGDMIVHDLAGWLMMPLALGFLWVELKIIDWLFVVAVPVDRDEILKVAASTAAGQWVVPERPLTNLDYDPDLAPKSPRTNANPAAPSGSP